MNGSESLAKRVRAAAVAGWWTVIIMAVIMAAQWLVVLAFLQHRPAWLLSLWGGGELDWPGVHVIMLYFFGAFKLILFAAVIIVIWLTLWARRLKKAGV